MYKEELLEHFKNPHNFGEVKNPTIEVSGVNSLCGDAVKITLKTDKFGIIKDIKFKSSGCAVSTAAASLLTDYLKGKNVSEVKKLDDNFMVKLLGGVTPARVRCAVLPLETLKRRG